MDAEKLNQELYDKMAAEQERFKHELLGMSAEEVLDHAYEYTIREDILMALEFNDLPASQAAVLLASPSPLADIFKDFRDMETGHMDHIRECIEGRADRLLETQREATRSIPLYRENVRYARENGELAAFEASYQANIACRDAIEAAILESQDGEQLSIAAKGVLAEFGPDRVSHVLAVTLLERRDDERLSRDAVAWAASVPKLNTRARCSDYMINSHSFHLDDFTALARRAMAAGRELQEPAAKKPSIKEQLTAKPVPGETPAKPRDKEAR